MQNRVLACFEYPHNANKKKIENIFKIIKEYRKTAKLISKHQWKLFFMGGSFSKYANIKYIESGLSERYKQVCLWQVVPTLDGFISNIANKIRQIIINSSLPKETKERLLFVNSINGWFLKLDDINQLLKKRNKNLEIKDEDLRLARNLFKHVHSNRRKPSFKHISMHLDGKVATIEKNKNSKSFYYWLKLSTLEKGKPILIPLKMNGYAENLEGEFLNFCQILEDNGKIKINLVKQLKDKKDSYFPQTDRVAIDIGLNPLIATDKGDLVGRQFFEKLKWFDQKITGRMSSLQKRGLKPSQDDRYREYIRKLKEFLKNEINRFLNRLVNTYKPKQIVVEKLNFTGPNLSKRLNRLIQNFGRGYFKAKLTRLEGIYDIEVIDINPAYTSQECNSCGYIDSKNRKNTQSFECRFCGKKINAQVNGAKNILKRASLLRKINPVATKKQILSTLVKEHIERIKGCSSAALDILKGNSFYTVYLDEYLNLSSCRNKFL